MEIYSEGLGDSLWLCSNNEMVDVVRKANPEAFWLTVDQIRYLLIINAMPGAIKCIGDIKSVYGDARIIKVISLESEGESLYERTRANQAHPRLHHELSKVGYSIQRVG